MAAAAERELRIKIQAVDAASNALRLTREELKKLKDEGDKAFSRGSFSDAGKRFLDQQERAQSAIKGLKHQTGEDSEFGLLAKTLGGAGALAGVGFAAARFNDLTKGVESLAVAAQKGDGSWKEQTASLLKAIPIAGQLAEGIDRIGGALKGEAQQLAKVNEESDHIKKRVEDYRALSQAIHAAGAAERDRQRLDGLAGADKAIEEARQKYEEELKEPRRERLEARAKGIHLSGDLLKDVEAQERGALQRFQKAAEAAREEEIRKLNDEGLKDFATREQAEKEGADKLAQIVAESEKNVGQARLDALRALGKDFEADLEGIKQSTDAALKDIEDRRAKAFEAAQQAGDNVDKNAFFDAAAKLDAERDAILKRKREQENAAARDQFFKNQDELSNALADTEEEKAKDRGPARLASLDESRTGSGILARLRSDLEVGAGGGDSPVALAKKTNDTLDKLPERIVKPIVSGFREVMREQARAATADTAAQVYSGT